MFNKTKHCWVWSMRASRLSLVSAFSGISSTIYNETTAIFGWFFLTDTIDKNIAKYIYIYPGHWNLSFKPRSSSVFFNTFILKPITVFLNHFVLSWSLMKKAIQLYMYRSCTWTQNANNAQGKTDHSVWPEIYFSQHFIHCRFVDYKLGNPIILKYTSYYQSCKFYISFHQN